MVVVLGFDVCSPEVASVDMSMIVLNSAVVNLISFLSFSNPCAVGSYPTYHLLIYHCSVSIRYKNADFVPSISDLSIYIYICIWKSK